MTAIIIPFRSREPVPSGDSLEGMLVDLFGRLEALHESRYPASVPEENLIERATGRLKKLRAIRGITLKEYDEMKRLEQLGMSLDQQLEHIVAARKPRPARRRT